MKRLLTSISLLVCCFSLFSQIKYEIELLPDNETYLVSFVSNVTYNPPGNNVVSGQVTIKMPHGIGVNAFEIKELNMETPGANWQPNDIVRSPDEAPSWDYISFALTTPGTSVYDFQAGVSIPVFSFKNGGEHCADSVYIIDNETDPFLPPNSINTDVSNTIVVVGGGFVNSYGGPVGTGSAPGTPATLCTDETLDEMSGCDSVMYQGLTITQDTVFETHYTSSTGCDSVFITSVIIQEELFNSVDTAICEGDIFKGQPILQDEVMTQTYTSSQGCDSTVTYTIQLLMPSVSETNITVLSGDEVNGVPVFGDTTIVSTLVNAVGCDSIATVHASVYDEDPTFVNGSICLGDSFNGVFYLQDTSFIDTLTSSSGFDSLVFTTIEVHQSYYITSHANLCLGEPYPLTGETYLNDTTFFESYQTVYGCDSIITTNIDIQIPTYSNLDTTICYGEQLFGETYEEDLFFTHTIVSGSGCDSVLIEVNLTVVPPIEANIEGETEICLGEETTLTATGGIQYQWDNGADNNNISAGAGTYEVTVIDATGCSETASVTVMESALSAIVETVDPTCYTDRNGSINLSGVSGGFEPYLYSIDGGNSFSTEAEFSQLPAGEYPVQIMDAQECAWQETVLIEAPEEVWVDVGSDQTINLGETIELRAFSNLTDNDSISWTPPDGLKCPTCLETDATPMQSTIYTIVVSDENGCSAEADVSVLVETQYDVYVPNAFSPNNDGINDTFTVFGGDQIERIVQFAVFERWGGQVFSAKNISPNNIPQGWDGKWQGEQAPEGVYGWMAEVEFIDGKKVLFEGDVNLMR